MITYDEALMVSTEVLERIRDSSYDLYCSSFERTLLTNNRSIICNYGNYITILDEQDTCTFRTKITTNNIIDHFKGTTKIPMLHADYVPINSEEDFFQQCTVHPEYVVGIFVFITEIRKILPRGDLYIKGEFIQDLHPYTS